MLHSYHLGKSPSKGALDFRKCKYSFANHMTSEPLITISFHPAFDIIAARTILDDRFIGFTKSVYKAQVENSIVSFIGKTSFCSAKADIAFR
jgi:hypothetical protein